MLFLLGGNLIRTHYLRARIVGQSEGAFILYILLSHFLSHIETVLPM